MAMKSGALRVYDARASLRLLIVFIFALVGTNLSAATLKQVRGEPKPSIQVINGQRPGSVEIRAGRPTDLAPVLIIERQRPDGSFEVVQNLDLGSLHLVKSCDQPIKRCVQINSRLHPVSWSGMSCTAQCQKICDKNTRLHGRFRFVVFSCDRKKRYEGASFSL
ncbi:hypothetical protein [Sphingomonas sp.]|uniref:hypothetical protein n=1 Tax=Sphingomonas sp. TaxID=28214 RepID=UPI003B39FCA7